jgi:hypothetical protein
MPKQPDENGWWSDEESAPVPQQSYVHDRERERDRNDRGGRNDRKHFSRTFFQYFFLLMKQYSFFKDETPVHQRP